MSRDLGFNDRVFGLGAGIFFASYMALQVPGALLVERWSARRMISGCMIVWGLLTMLTGLVQTPWHLYAARFVLGAAEAPFFPGVIEPVGSGSGSGHHQYNGKYLLFPFTLFVCISENDDWVVYGSAVGDGCRGVHRSDADIIGAETNRIQAQPCRPTSGSSGSLTSDKRCDC